jgi:hypothetical protein
MRPLVFISAAAGAILAGGACGADNQEAPAPPAPAQPACRSFEELMPNFVAAISNGGTDGLKQVVETYLINPPQPNEPAPAADVLRALTQAVAALAAYPPEPGAAAGEICADPPTPIPPLSQANPLCELRRVLDSLVHAGNGLTALGLLDPLLSGALDYIIGRLPSSSLPHYEVAGEISGLCEQSAVCQTDDTLDLVIALTSYLGTSNGKQFVGDVATLVNNPALAPYLTDNGAQYGGPAGVQALVQILIQTLEGLQSASQLGSALSSVISVLPADIQPDVETVVNDLEQMLQPAVLNPLKRVLNCYSAVDQSSPQPGSVVLMVYNLAFSADLPAFQIGSLITTIQGLQNTDQRGSLLYLVNLFATLIRNDPTAPTSLGEVCSTIFTPSNASLALPDIATLFEQGVGGEAVCAVDTLIYGCSGSTQPACQGIP